MAFHRRSGVFREPKAVGDRGVFLGCIPRKPVGESPFRHAVTDPHVASLPALPFCLPISLPIFGDGIGKDWPYSTGLHGPDGREPPGRLVRSEIRQDRTDQSAHPLKVVSFVRVVSRSPVSDIPLVPS